MPRFLHQLSLILAVTLMVALQGFAVRDAQNTLEHSSLHSTAAYAGFQTDDLDRGHHPKVRDPDGTVASFAAAPLIRTTLGEMAPEGDSPTFPHHHHGGADHSLVVAATPEAASGPPNGGDCDAPPTSLRHPGARSDGLLDPPRQHA